MKELTIDATVDNITSVTDCSEILLIMLINPM